MASPTLRYALYARQNKESLWSVGLGPGDAQGYYGVSVSVGTSDLVVGASGGFSEAGKLIVYPNNDGKGFDSSVKYVLTPSPELPVGAGFGNAISQSGEYLAVGCSSYLDYSGAVYVYSLDAASKTFVQQQVLSNPSDPATGTIVRDNLTGSEFSDSVFVDADSQTIIVSEPNYRQSDGMVTVYLLDTNSGVWKQSSAIPGPDRRRSYFGSPLAATSLLLAVSAIRNPQQQQQQGQFGSVFIYTRPDYSSPYSQTQEISASSAGAPSTAPYSFGNSLALSADSLFVGTGQTGSVYVFAYTGASAGADAKFVYSQTITAPKPTDAAYLGYSMALQGSVLALGHMDKDVLANNQRSGVYIFGRSGKSAAAPASWSALQYISAAPDVNSLYQYLGSALGLAPDGTLAVTNVGDRFAQGNMLLFSPSCTPGSYLSAFPTCSLCPAGSYDSAAGKGQSAAACLLCPASRSGTSAGSTSCTVGTGKPSRRPTISPTPVPSAPSAIPSSSTFQRPTANPTELPTAPSPFPTHYPLLTFRPSLDPTASPTSSRLRPPAPTPAPTCRPTLRPTSYTALPGNKPVASLASGSSADGGADADGLSKAAIVSSVVACLVLVGVSFLCYRRYFRKVAKDLEDLEKANEEAEAAAANAGGGKKQQPRMTAYDKWCVYEDSVRARRISSMFQMGDHRPSGSAAAAAAASSSPPSPTQSSVSPGMVELNSGLLGRLSASARNSLSAAANANANANAGAGAGAGASGGGAGAAAVSLPPPRPSHGSFSELGGLFSAEQQAPAAAAAGSSSSSRLSFSRPSLSGPSTSTVSARPSVVVSAAQVVGTAPEALDEDLRASLAELDQADLPPITVAEAAAAVQEVLALEHAGAAEADGAASASTLNPLMGGSFRPTASITSIRAAQSASGRRLSVTAATRVGNPLFNAQARRESLNVRLGLPPAPATAPATATAPASTAAPAPSSIAKSAPASSPLQRVSDLTPDFSIEEERPSEIERGD